jgi:hypothetical protein
VFANKSFKKGDLVMVENVIAEVDVEQLEYMNGNDTYQVNFSY